MRDRERKGIQAKQTVLININLENDDNLDNLVGRKQGG